MIRREHLFITTQYFQKCHEFSIFGVGKNAVNQLGLVNKGDKIFFLSKDDEKIHGYYTVSSDIFFNDEVIWKKKGEGDAYPYRVLLIPQKIKYIDLDKFSQLAEENDMRIDSGDIQQKSVLTLLPKDFGVLEKCIQDKGTEYKQLSRTKEFARTPISVSFAIKKGFSEAFFEFLMLKKADFFDNKFLLTNQFRINITGSKIDVLALSREKIKILELKARRINEGDEKQFHKYVRWVKNNRNLLSKFFKLNLLESEIESFLLRGVVEKEEVLIEDYFKKKVIATIKD